MENCSTSGGSGRCGGCGAATDEYSLFAVFDGHNGVAAARMTADLLVGTLEERLPPGPPPAPTSPGFLPWREDIQLALIETLAELNKVFAMKGILAGCTASLVLQVGWLVTTANLGDSRAIMDTGLESHMLTVDHRVATHKGERRRVEAMGNTIAPIDFSGSGPATRVDNGVGPLRIWPGGLCLSRAIGDFDVGDAVIPFPHVMQFMVPASGGRLLVASDGVWDAYEKMSRIGSLLRSWSLDSAPQKLIQSIVRAYGGLRDDTSLIIVDMLPPGKVFSECAAAVSQRFKAANMAVAAAGGTASGGGASGGGVGCGCFGSSAPSPSAGPAAPPPPVAARAACAERAAVGKLEVLADVDVAAVMGLMPGTTPAMPGWYDRHVGEQLCALAAEAMEGWHEAHERRTGRRPPTPQLDSSVRAARAAKAALAATGESELLVDAEGAAWAPAPGGTGMRRTASMFFAASVAQGEEDYADKFGHYKGEDPGSLGSLSGSPGSSMHSGPAGALATAATEGSVRCGGYRYGDTSVRAGSRFVGDASVRAGSAYYGGGGGSSGQQQQGQQQGGQQQGQQQGQRGAAPFRADPSIRMGSAYFRSRDVSERMEISSVAGEAVPAAGSSVGARTAAGAAGEEEAVAEGRQHGRRGSGAAGAALAAAAAAAAVDSPPKNGGAAPGVSSRSGAQCASASSAPIPVPRSVAFGAVTVLGDSAEDAGRGGGGSGHSLIALPPAGKLPMQAPMSDSPIDHSGLLRQTDSSTSTSGFMATIVEGQLS